MNPGTKIQIKLKDKRIGSVCGLGYLVKEINKNCYEIWCEEHQTILVVSKKDFTEFKENDEK